MNSRFFLVFSLALNLVLLAALAARYGKGATPAPQITRTRFITNDAGQIEPGQSLPEDRDIPFDLPFHWNQIASEDYKDFFANLRGIGCPEETIRLIVQTLIENEFTRRRHALLQPIQGQFWVLASKGEESVGNKIDEQLDSLREEKARLLKVVLGPEPPGKTEAARLTTYQSVLADCLPQETIAALDELNAHFAALQQQIAQQPLPEAERQKQIQSLNDQHHAQARALLSPQEFEEFQLRQSNVAQLRSNLIGIELSEDDFRQLARLRLAVEQAHPELSSELGGDQASTSNRQKELESLFQERVKALWGPARAAELERAQDDQFQAIYRLAANDHLPRQATIQVYEFQKTAETQARQVRAQADLTDDQRYELLQTIRKQTERQALDLFGPNGWKSFQRFEWVQKLGKMD